MTLRMLFVAAAVVVAFGVTPAPAQVVSCTWTDNPIVSGETPIKAAHINEIRACIDQILNGGGTQPEPPEGGHFVVSNLRQYAQFAGAPWLYFYVTARSAIQEMTLDVRFEHPAGTFSRCTPYLYNLVVDQLVEVSVIPESCGPSIAWVTVRIAPPEGFTCEGCGAYSAADIPSINTMSQISEVLGRSTSPRRSPSSPLPTPHERRSTSQSAPADR